MVVAGGGRSGLAAAELLLSRRRARHAERPARARGRRRPAAPRRDGRRRAAPGRACSRARTSSCSVPACRPSRTAVQAARRAGVPVMGEIELASRWLSGRVDRDHRHERQVDDDHADRAHAAGGAASTRSPAATSAPRLSTQVASSHPGALHVVEVSSFQLETTDTFHPWIAVLLNLSPDHLDRHPTFEAYAAAKARIFANQTRRRLGRRERRRRAVDGAGGRRACAPFRFRARRRRSRDGVTVDGGDIVRRDAGRAAPLVAGVVGAAAGPASAGRRAGGHRGGVPRGRARRRRCGGRSKGSPACRTRSNASPRSTAWRSSTIRRRRTSRPRAARWRAFAGGVVAIMGGRFKGGDFADLRDVVRAHATGIVAIGEAAPLIEDALGAVGAGAARGVDGRGRAPRRSAWRRPAASCCSRRRVRVSTCSGTTSIEASSFGRRSGIAELRSSKSEVRGVEATGKRSSSHQIGRGGEEPAAGNTGRSGL